MTMSEHRFHDEPGDQMVCGVCGRSWCDLCHPTPAGRCLYENEHEAPETARGHKVCPNCKTDDRLYSCERITAMYPITVQGSEVDYKLEPSEVLDDTGEFEDDLWCRGCNNQLTLADLIDAEEE